jgi:hypothetical protein
LQFARKGLPIVQRQHHAQVGHGYFDAPQPIR